MDFDSSYDVERVATFPSSAKPQEFSPYESESSQWTRLRIAGESGSWFAKFRHGTDIGAAVTGLFTTPSSRHLCVVAGGQAYWVNADDAASSVAISAIFPVMSVCGSRNLLLLIDYTNIAAFGEAGFAWRTDRLSWDGIVIDDIRDTKLFGSGWSAPDDRWVPFTVDLTNGGHLGGPGFQE